MLYLSACLCSFRVLPHKTTAYSPSHTTNNMQFRTFLCLACVLLCTSTAAASSMQQTSWECDVQAMASVQRLRRSAVMTTSIVTCNTSYIGMENAELDAQLVLSTSVWGASSGSENASDWFVTFVKVRPNNDVHALCLDCAFSYCMCVCV